MTGRRRLLVVDDEAEIVELLRLTFEDFEVDTALDADSALARLRVGTFDALITDVRMPGRSGLTLIDHAVELSPGIVVIVITGHHQEFGSDRRVARWIPKPFSISGIRATLLHELGLT
ncbi:MAG TPA: response regulator [Vicinamibacterales bacterium]|nr:response regulator [Vicinamibacterales bacterium]